MAHDICGRFHQWGCAYQEFETGPGNFTTAIIELDDGKIVEADAGSVQFLDADTEALTTQLAAKDTEISRVAAERDTAVEDIQHPSVCECCVHCGDCQGDSICIDNEYMNFEWRGRTPAKQDEEANP